MNEEGTGKTQNGKSDVTILDAAALLSRRRELRRVDVPEPAESGRSGAVVYVRELSVGERDAFEKAIYGEGGDRAQVRAALLVRALCDENGNRLFTDDQMQELADSLPGCVGVRLFDQACEINGVGQSEVEELEKN